MGGTHRIGVVGLGAISRVYLETLQAVDDVRIVAVADLDIGRAESVARSNSGVRASTVAALMGASDIDAVLNLTIPAAHAEVAAAAIRAGKDVYGEKPLAADVGAARALVRDARAAGMRLGCAPDTVLGTGVQTARAVIDQGRIGRPMAATAMMATPGHERWHPNPDFYYAPGGGPLLDMGPYYLTALVHLLGPIRRVIGASSRLRDERRIGSGAREGERVPVDVDTHVAGVLEHESGALSTIVMSFDSVATAAPPIEVHGERGSLTVPDPNGFDGTPAVRLLGDPGWEPVPPLAGIANGRRGAGLIEMLRGERAQPPRASADLGLHVLDAMTALLDAARRGAGVTLSTRAERPPLVPLIAGIADL